MLRIHEIKLKIGEGESLLRQRIAAKLNLGKQDEISEMRIVRKSIDARNKAQIRFVYTLDFTVNPERSEAALLKRAARRSAKLEMIQEIPYLIPDLRNILNKRDVNHSQNTPSTADSQNIIGKGDARDAQTTPKTPATILNHRPHQPVIVGFGPCGLFAAYILAKAGLRPIVLERGRPVEQRGMDVAAYWRSGVPDTDSNVLFGEGGAGAFSDGKLTTGIGDRRKQFVLDTLAAAGGSDAIRYAAKPHIGTDLLKGVLQNLRTEIIRAGGEIRFGHKLEKLRLSDTQNTHFLDVDVLSGESGRSDASPVDSYSIEIHHLILAIGHSARDTLAMLLGEGLPMAQKPFSMGLRVAHPQSLIDAAQYGAGFQEVYGMGCREAGLPASEYKLSYKCGNGRGVYTFCMCPGGTVVAAASEQNGICTNGMSGSARDGTWANSAVLVDVRPADFGGNHPLSGIEFQRRYERAAFELLKKRGFSSAPDSEPQNPIIEFDVNRALGRLDHALSVNPTLRDLNRERVTDLTPGSSSPKSVGYIPTEPLAAFAGADSLLAGCLPDFVRRGILEAMPAFGKKIAGFDAPDTCLFGPETRSSSPVRILRDAQMASGFEGIYPCGEGAGYAGGIMSAAVDGIKAAERICRDLDAENPIFSSRQ